MNHSQYRIASKLVEMIHQDFQGFHPGYRDVHASGRYYAGEFKATPEARKLSRAVNLQGDSRPCDGALFEQQLGESLGTSDDGLHGRKILSSRWHNDRSGSFTNPGLSRPHPRRNP